MRFFTTLAFALFISLPVTFSAPAYACGDEEHERKPQGEKAEKAAEGVEKAEAGKDCGDKCPYKNKKKKHNNNADKANKT